MTTLDGHRRSVKGAWKLVGDAGAVEVVIDPAAGPSSRETVLEPADEVRVGLKLGTAGGGVVASGAPLSACAGEGEEERASQLDR